MSSPINLSRKATFFGCTFILVMGAVMGFWLGHEAASRTAPSPAQDSQVLAPSADRYEAASDGEMMATLRAIDWKAQNVADDPQFAKRIGRSPGLIGEVLKLFQGAPSDVEFQIAQFLALVPSGEVRSTAMQWAQDANDAGRQRDGFFLLSQLKTDEPALSLAISHLNSQKNEQTLEHVIWSLHRVEVPKPDVAGQVAAKLAELTGHPHPPVRAASIQRLADWDREGTFVEDRLAQLLNDPDPEVRLSAIGATSIQALSTPVIKKGLLRIAADRDQEPMSRQFALSNLERFYFNSAEFDLYQMARKDVFSSNDAK